MGSPTTVVIAGSGIAGLTMALTCIRSMCRHYPISSVGPDTGLQLQNWIAELTIPA